MSSPTRAAAPVWWRSMRSTTTGRGNRLTLTVVLDDFTGRTRVHCISGGGGEGLFRFDWGAAESFEGVVHDALSHYRL